MQGTQVTLISRDAAAHLHGGKGKEELREIPAIMNVRVNQCNYSVDFY